MRTSFLQDLYLQKPVTLTVLIAVLSVLPWIGLGDFATKGEPREAAVAVSMLKTGNGILPAVYADELAYKPPLAHWLMVVASYPQGYVSEFTARLPSALALIILIGAVVVFFGRRTRKFHEALVTACILITCIEIHRAGMTARVDMLLTTLIVMGLFGLYRWKEKRSLKGLPLEVSLLLGLATLVKGPVGIVLPLFVFGVYLLLEGKYPCRMIFRSLFYVGLSSVFIPSLWYLAAWNQGGQGFLNLVIAENFGRFFHIEIPAIHYELGHEKGLWYNFVTLIAGFVPWTIALLCAFPGLKWTWKINWKEDIQLLTILRRLRSMEAIQLFSLVAATGIIFFYSIPSSKRSVYLMPAYPFIAFFLSQYLLHIVEHRTKVLRAFAFLVTTAAAFTLLLALLTATSLIDPAAFAAACTDSEITLHVVQTIVSMLTSPDMITCLILSLFFIILLITCRSLYRRINIKILYSVIALLCCLNFFIDGVVMRGERRSGSIRPFAERIMQEYPLQGGNIYVMNDLHHYPNLYGLNFYLGNIFLPFDLSFSSTPPLPTGSLPLSTGSLPAEGYLLSGDLDLKKIRSRYADKYAFQPLATTPYPHKEIRQKVVLSHFHRQ
jgi:4-amino-4-deoxy-L-arabinose transferase-like glycosyltransferase